MAKIDDTIARITYEQLYRIMDDIKERRYTHIKKMIAEEVQSLGKRCRHFHVEVDLWDEETNKRHYAALSLIRWIRTNNTGASAWISSSGKALQMASSSSITSTTFWTNGIFLIWMM